LDVGHGKGVPLPSKYDGEFKDGEFHGKGVFTDVGQGAACLNVLIDGSLLIAKIVLAHRANQQHRKGKGRICFGGYLGCFDRRLKT
jgi:hypothetical protein